LWLALVHHVQGEVAIGAVVVRYVWQTALLLSRWRVNIRLTHPPKLVAAHRVIIAPGV
jgi:hypothetical protein